MPSHAPHSDPDEVTLVCAPILRAALGTAFRRQLLDLQDLYGDELTDDIVLNELADYLRHLLTRVDVDDELEAACEGLERLCETPGIDPLTTVVDQILRQLPDSALRRLGPYLGMLTETAIAQADEDTEFDALTKPATTRPGTPERPGSAAPAKPSGE